MKFEKVYDSRQVCEILNISIPTLRSWEKTGKIKYGTYKNSNRHLFTEEEISRILKELKTN